MYEFKTPESIDPSDIESKSLCIVVIAKLNKELLKFSSERTSKIGITLSSIKTTLFKSDSLIWISFDIKILDRTFFIKTLFSISTLFEVKENSFSISSASEVNISSVV